MTSFLAQAWLWAMVQAFIVLGTAILILFQLRTQTAAHVVQTLTAIHARWNEKSMLRARLHVCTTWVEGKEPLDEIGAHVADFMEELGAYVIIKAVPPKAMWESQSWYIEHYYCFFQNGIASERQSYHDKNVYANLDLLFKEMSRISKRRGSPHLQRGRQDLDKFAQEEIRVCEAFLSLHDAESSRGG